MKYRVFNDEGTDFVDFEGDTIEDIRHQASNRITLPTWKNGYSEKLED